MKYRNREVVDAVPYAPGLEDGFDDTRLYFGQPSPYVLTGRGREVVGVNDFILTDAFGTRRLVNAVSFARDYEPLGEA